VELYLHSPNTPSWRGAQFKKTQGQLQFYLTVSFKGDLEMKNTELQGEEQQTVLMACR
jgi:hypothetical protein